MSLSARECWPIDKMSEDEMFVNEMTVDVKMLLLSLIASKLSFLFNAISDSARDIKHNNVTFFKKGLANRQKAADKMSITEMKVNIKTWLGC